MLAGVVISQNRLHQLGSEPGRPIARAVLTTDIVSSTDLTRTLGDERRGSRCSTSTTIS